MSDKEIVESNKESEKTKIKTNSDVEDSVTELPENNSFGKNDEYSCNVCGKNLATKEILRDHIKIIHMKKIYKQCSLCELKFPTEAALKLHINIIHSAVSKKLPCNQCGKTFGTSFKVKTHIRLTHGDPFICQLCGNSYTRKTGLLNHEKDIHGLNCALKLFCDSCGKSYNSRKRLKDHMWLIHHTDKHPVCTDCGKSFATRTKLKEHINTHTGEQPYSCPKSCGGSFKSSGQLSNHKKKCQI